MEKVTIRFKNGTEIKAEQNGTSFITDTKPDIPSDLSEVAVTEESGERIISNAELIECASVDGRYWFTFVEIPESVREAKQIRADVDYIALETGVEL